VGGERVDVARGLSARVLICLADETLNASLATALEASGFATESGQDPHAVLSVAADEYPVLLIDDRSPNWLRTTVDLVGRRPDLRPVVLAEIDGPDEFLVALTGGVCGFCRADAGVDSIVRTVQSVCDSGVAIPRDMVGPLVALARHGRGHRMNTIAGPIDVTDREWQIMQLVLQRRTTREIADALFVSSGTVRSHLSALMHKVGAVDRDDLIAMVERSQQR
jgi:DNA-binding NarL/FixJ family response regulator